MTATFPTAVPSYTNPTSANKLGTSVGGATHSTQHANINDDIEAIATKLGISAASPVDTPAADLVLISDATGKSKWATVNSAMITDGTIVNADVSASAEIAVSKLADGDALALLRTASDGTTVEWGSAGQIAFPATQNASADGNTLDDYEEGTWTPFTAGGGTFATQQGTYTKTGRQFIADFNFSITTLSTGSPTTISGLPYTVNGTPNNGQAGSMFNFSGLAVSTLALYCYAVASSTTIKFAHITAAGVNISDGPSILGNGATVQGKVIAHV